MHRFIIGLNDNPNYYGILPLVYQAYKKFFPDMLVVIALVVDVKNKSLINKIIQHCDFLSIYPTVDNVPTGNLAKMSRYFEATKESYSKDICIMNDIDIIPLQKEYYINRMWKRPKYKLLAVGAECYNNGKFPTTFCTGEGQVFKRFVNPNNLGWTNFVRSTYNIKNFYTSFIL